MSSYARLQLLNSDSKQTTGQINLKLTRVTPAGLEVFKEVSTTYKALVHESHGKSMVTANRVDMEFYTPSES